MGWDKHWCSSYHQCEGNTNHLFLFLSRSLSFSSLLQFAFHLLIGLQTAKIESIIILQKSGRVTMLQAGRACIWASSETEKICMINAQVPTLSFVSPTLLSFVSSFSIILFYCFILPSFADEI